MLARPWAGKHWLLGMQVARSRECWLQSSQGLTLASAWLTAMAMALSAAANALELAADTDCTVPPLELAIELATAPVLVGLATPCVSARWFQGSHLGS